jgi:hypothetical protein
MTCEVIDRQPLLPFAVDMRIDVDPRVDNRRSDETVRPSRPTARYDRTLRVVMWMDAFLSVELVAVATIVSPIVAVVGIGAPTRLVLGITVLVCAVLLAAFGAITGVVLMLRMRAGVYFLPAGLNLAPLPSGMRPTIVSAPGAEGG